MLQFNTASKEERAEILKKAIEWAGKHESHIKALLAEGDAIVPPSGSDMFKPELWKGSHWRWMRELMNFASR